MVKIQRDGVSVVACLDDVNAFLDLFLEEQRGHLHNGLLQGDSPHSLLALQVDSPHSRLALQGIEAACEAIFRTAWAGRRV